MRVRRFASVGAVALACALLVAPLAALAQTPGDAALTTAIREISFDTKGNTNVVVSVTGTALSAAQALSSDDFNVTEGGKKVQGLTAQKLSESNASAVAVALVFDVSGSTAGAPLNAAKTAAKE